MLFPRRPAILTLLVLLLLLVPIAGGCFREPTASQRIASFRSVAHTRIDDLSLADFTARRTVYLLATPAGDFVADEPGRLVLTNVRSDSAEVRLYTGTAVVLTRDGYLMTAAHCAVAPNLTVIPAHAGGRIALGGLLRPRVVWFGKSGDPLTDLAILKVDGTFPDAFEWSETPPTRKTPVAIAGIDLARYRLAFSYAAGRVIDPAWMRSPGTPVIDAVTHNAPLRRGDSGGPLVVTSDGRLAAINVAVRFGLGPQFSVSLRPDPRWVREVIETDRASATTSARSDPSTP